MNKLFDRYLSLFTTGAFTVKLDELHCKISISGATTGSPNICDVNIYNIAYNTVAKIKAGDILTVDAGYKDLHAIIFTGKIVNTRYGKVNGVDTYLNLQCNNIEIQNKIIAETYSKNTSKAIVMQGMTSKAGLVGISGLNHIPRDQYRRAKVVFGTAQDVLKPIERSNDLYFSFNGKQYAIYDIGNLIAADVVILNKDTGLIERPKITQQGIEGRCLVNPRIKVGSMVQIMRTSIDEFKQDLSYSGQGKATLAMPYDADGLYWIVKTSFSLDNRGKEWYIDFQAVNSTSVRAAGSKNQLGLR